MLKKDFTILLVEDNPADVLLIKHLTSKLPDWTVSVVVAETVRAALQLLHHEAARFDLLLLDLYLPDSDAAHTFQHFHAFSHDIPTIILSGSDDRAVAVRAMQEGAQDYLTKGEIDGKLIEKALRYAVERNKFSQECQRVTQELRSREQLLQLITRISSTFINLSSDQIDQAIAHDLGQVGTFLAADHAFLFRVGEGGVVQGAYEWAASDAFGQAARPADVPASLTSAAIEALARGLQHYPAVLADTADGGLFVLNTTDELPPDADPLRQALRDYGAESVLLVAIFYQNQLTGMFGLAARQPYQVWHPQTISLLNPCGEIFYRAIEKKQTEQLIRESEAKYRTLVENMNEGLLTVSKEGRITFVNGQFCQLFGYSAQELIGRLATDPAWPDGPARETVLNHIQQRLANQPPEQYELPIRGKSGETTWVLINGHAVRNGHGQPVGTMATIVDISDRKRIEEKLTRVNQELKAFVYRASHDLRGPLATVLGLTNLAQLYVQDPEATRYFDLIRTSTDKLERTLRALMEVSSVTQTAEELSSIDFQALLDDTVTPLWEKAALDQPASLLVTIEQPAHFVSGQQPVRHILESLVDNAIKYRSPSRPLALEVGVCTTDRGAEITVRDNGEGIPADLHERVFEMFFRGNETSRGSGLGLYLVEKCVASLNGKMRLQSTAGKGTFLVVELPNRG